MRWLGRIAKDADAYVIILLGFVLALLGAFGVVQFSVLASGILTTLALVVFAMLVTRHRIDDLAVKTDNVLTAVSKLPEEAHARDVITSLDASGSLETFLSGSREVFMSGISLITRASMLTSAFRRMLENGCSFRIVLVDPASSNVPALARGQRRTDEQGLRDEIGLALSLFRQLSEYADTHNTPGKLKCVTFDYIPTLTLMRTVNAATGRVIIHVEIPAYHAGIGERPVFRVEREDGDLFTFFERVCSDLWADAIADAPKPGDR